MRNHDQYGDGSSSHFKKEGRAANARCQASDGASGTHQDDAATLRLPSAQGIVGLSSEEWLRQALDDEEVNRRLIAKGMWGPSILNLARTRSELRKELGPVDRAELFRRELLRLAKKKVDSYEQCLHWEWIIPRASDSAYFGLDYAVKRRLPKYREQGIRIWTSDGNAHWLVLALRLLGYHEACVDAASKTYGSAVAASETWTVAQAFTVLPAIAACVLEAFVHEASDEDKLEAAAEIEQEVRDGMAALAATELKSTYASVSPE